MPVDRAQCEARTAQRPSPRGEALSMTARRFLSLCLSLAMIASSRFRSATVKTLACFILKTSSNVAIHEKTLYFLMWVKSIGR